MKTELLHYWEEGKPIPGYKPEEEEIVKNPLHNVEDALFAFIVGLLY